MPVATTHALVAEGLPPSDCETAIAMGYAVDRQEELLSNDGAIEGELDWTLGAAAFARAFAEGKAVTKACLAQAEVLRSIARSLPADGRALVVSHGGLIEPGLVECFPEGDHGTWGQPFDNLEGARLQCDDGGWVKVELLRVGTP